MTCQENVYKFYYSVKSLLHYFDVSAGICVLENRIKILYFVSHTCFHCEEELHSSLEIDASVHGC